MIERYPQHQFICFNTIFNRGLLGQVPANVELNTLSLGSYFEDVGRLCAEKHLDVLFRGYPLEQHVDFPLHRQVVEIPDIQHEYFPDFFDAALRAAGPLALTLADFLAAGLRDLGFAGDLRAGFAGFLAMVILRNRVPNA